MHLQIKPGLRQVWRGPTTLQVGLDPRHGVLLDGLTPADLPLLQALTDGVDLARRTLAPRQRELVRLLTGAGVLVARRAGRGRLAALGPHRERLAPDAAAWSLIDGEDDDGWDRLATRRRRCVRVVGAGRTGAAVAATLAATGVGQVLVVDPAAAGPDDLSPAGLHADDLGGSRQDAAQRAIGRVLGVLGALGGPSPATAAEPDLVVLVDRDVADAAATTELLATDTPHLSVVVREGGLVVGPLVLPGRSACLRCLDLHRAERDPGWPRVLAQLLGGRGTPATTAEEVASAQLAASLASLQVLGVLDAARAADGSKDPATRPAAVSATLEIDLPDGLISRREWAVHPGCGCADLPGVPSQIAQPQPAGATMAP
jgi:hypothetical protein